MPQRPPIAVIEVNLEDVTDATFVDESLRGDMGRKPCQWPIDGQTLFVAHRGGHSVRLGETGCEGFFHDDVGPEGRDLFDGLGVASSGRTQQHNIGLCGFHAATIICEYGLGRESEVFDTLLHFLRIRVAYADDFHVRMLERHSQIIPHVHVFEVDACDSPCLAHSFLLVGSDLHLHISIPVLGNKGHVQLEPDPIDSCSQWHYAGCRDK